MNQQHPVDDDEGALDMTVLVDEEETSPYLGVVTLGHPRGYSSNLIQCASLPVHITPYHRVRATRRMQGVTSNKAS